MKKQYRIDFLNFIGIKEEAYCVVRIVSDKDYIKKCPKKSQDFERLNDAVRYFESIKNEKQKGAEVMTAIFRGTQLLHKYQKISHYIEENQHKLSI